MKHGRYSLIYQYFQSQIRFGYLKKGDTLPSIELLHEVHHAAVRTVRNAYLLLQEEGYICVSPGRNTEVIYDASPEQCLRDSQDYYLSRKEAFDVLNQTLKILLIPLLREGAQRLQKHDMRLIKENAATLQNGDFYISFFCGRQMLLSLKNRLALDLYYDISSFYQFPHFLAWKVPIEGSSARFQQLSSEAIAACENNDSNRLFHVYLSIQDFLNETIQAYLSEAGQVRPVKEQVPFEWRVYRERPQICYSLAAQLIGMILINQVYAPGDFLPSYHEMAKHFSVSLSTIRRMAELLEKLGIVTSIQGVGTQVLPRKRKSPYLPPAAAQKILAKCLEVIQIIRISFDSIIQQFFPKPKGKLENCLRELRDLQEEGASFRAFLTCLGYLFYGSDSNPLEAVWEKLYEILLLGLPIVEMQTADPNMAHRLSHCTGDLIQSLETQQLELFRNNLNELMILATAAAEKAFDLFKIAPKSFRQS